MPKIIDAETLKATPVSIGLMLTIIPALVWAWTVSRDWHYETFATLQAAEANARSVTQEVQETQKILEDHIVEFRIARAQDRLDELENTLFFLERDRQAQGESELLLQRIDQVRHEIEETQEYLDCLISVRPNCKHLEPRRR
jgi:hypothetical protein